MALLKSAPSSFNINWIHHRDKCGFLQIACCWNRHHMVTELLKHPDIDPNLRDDHDENAAFMKACYFESVQCVSLLLNDARVDVNWSTIHGDTGLSIAASCGFTQVVEHILASMRQIDESHVIFARKQAEKGTFFRKEEEYPKIASILLEYQLHPFETMRKLRIKLKLEDGPSSVFTHVALLCDGYYALQNKEATTSMVLSLFSKLWDNQTIEANFNELKAFKFFYIMLQLPMELHMVICNRIFDSPKNLIKASRIEAVLRGMIAEGSF